jgi:DnaK suppressor protein
MATRKSQFNKKELDGFRARLEEERTELQGQLNELEETSFSSSQSDLSGEVGLGEEYADAGTATFEREKDLSIENNVRDLMIKIDKALEKISEGTYGICERCGKPIEKVRIKALPYASLCKTDAQAESRRR